MNHDSATIAAAAHYSRHHRRKLQAFGRAARGVVITALIPSGAPLRGHPYSQAIVRAVADWCTAGGGACFCCHQAFTAGDIAGASGQPPHPRRRRHFGDLRRVLARPK